METGPFSSLPRPPSPPLKGRGGDSLGPEAHYAGGTSGRDLWYDCRWEILVSLRHSCDTE